jgi:hypothetical protein
LADQQGTARFGHPARRPRRLFWHALRIVVGLGLLTYLVSRLDLDVSFAVIAAARLDFLALLLTAFFGIRLLAAYRWWLLLRGRQLQIAFAGVVRLIFVSGFVGYFLPGGVGIELARIYGLVRGSADPALAVSSVLVERFLAIFALVLLVLTGMAVRPLPGLTPEVGRLAWVGLCLLIAMVLLLWDPRLRSMVARRWRGRLMPLRGRVVNVVGVLDAYRQQPGLMIGSLTLAILFQLARCVATAIGAAALGADLPFIVFLVITPIAILIGLAPISIGGLGVQEAAYVYLLGLVGTAPEIALPLALLIRIMGLLVNLPGAWFYMRGGIAEPVRRPSRISTGDRCEGSQN